MEKNQHNAEGTRSGQQSENIPAQAPGQEVPQNREASGETTASEKDVHHSESSLPQNDNETLGTP